MSAFTALSPALQQAIQGLGFTAPSEFQSHAIPQALGGSSLIVQGKPGTGKTVALCLSLLHRVKSGEGLQAIVLVPTHELAVQVLDTLKILGDKMAVTCHLSIGGTSVKEDLKEVREGAEVVVGTLGRLTHLLSMKKGLPVSSLRILAIDEVDLFFTKRTRASMTEVGEMLPDNLQVLVFATTLPAKVLPAVQQFVSEHSAQEAKTHLLTRKELMTTAVEQFYVNTNDEKTKNATVCKLYSQLAKRKVLIFCNLRKSAEDLVRALNQKGHTLLCLHSDMSESARQGVVSTFRESAAVGLVTTDLLSRGFDLPSISVVVNCNTPSEDEYLHRAYRSSRFSAKGTVITVLKPKEAPLVGRLQRQFGAKVSKWGSS